MWHLALIMLILARAASLAAQPPTPIGALLPDLAVVETIEIDLQGAAGLIVNILLDPAGEQILQVTSTDFCVYDRSGAPHSCLPRPDDLRFVVSPRWSPDGQYIAFTDHEPLRNFDDSDLWIWDTHSGHFTHLTADGDLPSALALLSGADANAGPFSTVDMLPRFSSDGQLYFLRLAESGGNATAAIYRIPVTGGTAELVTPITANIRETGTPIAWDIAPDGQTAVIVQRLRGNQSLHRVDLLSSAQTLLHEVDRDTEIGILALDFSPSGEALLWHSEALSPISNAGDRPYAYITTLEGETFPATSTAQTLLAGWSADGSALIYSVFDAENPARTGLYLGLPGADGSLLISPENADQWFVGTNFPHGLDWGANHTVLVSERGGRSVLVLRLGVE